MNKFKKFIKNIPRCTNSIDDLIKRSGTDVFLIKDSQYYISDGTPSYDPSKSNHSIVIYTRDLKGNLLEYKTYLGEIDYRDSNIFGQRLDLNNKKQSIVFDLKSKVTSLYKPNGFYIGEIVDYSKLDSNF